MQSVNLCVLMIPRRDIFLFLAAVIVLAAGLSSCARQSGISKSLADVESFIGERPDSALAVLQEIDPETVPSGKTMAKYSLLLSIALDKNYIDRTDFDILQPAIDYYSSHGSATDRLRAAFYQGRIYQNAGNNELAMECFIKAIDVGEASDDLVTKAHAYAIMAELYKDLYDMDSAVESHRKAKELYKEAGREVNYFYAVTDLISDYAMLLALKDINQSREDSDNVNEYIQEGRSLLENSDSDEITAFYSVYLSYLGTLGEGKKIEETVNEYIHSMPADQIEWLTVASAYNEIGRYSDAMQVVEHYAGENSRRYYAIVSDIYDNLGRYKDALEAYKEYLNLETTDTYGALSQGTRFVAERYNLRAQSERERAAKYRILIWAAVIFLFLAAVIVWILSRLKLSRMQKTLAEQECDKYRLMCSRLQDEREDLAEIISQTGKSDPEVRAVVAERLDLLNRFLSAYIADSDALDSKATDEMERLLANKGMFMSSTRQAFAASHPDFIKYLSDHGLTEWETEYCCLYAIGLRGKEVGSYIDMSSHYKASSDIRKKLGIDSHDTNLSIYIRRLLKTVG